MDGRRPTAAADAASAAADAAVGDKTNLHLTV